MTAPVTLGAGGGSPGMITGMPGGYGVICSAQADKWSDR
jgi:hypothetical protein